MVPLGNSLHEVLAWLWLLQAVAVGFHADGRDRSGYGWFGLTLVGGPLAALYYARQPRLSETPSAGQFRRHAVVIGAAAAGVGVGLPVSAVLSEVLVTERQIPYTAVEVAYDDYPYRSERISDFLFFGTWAAAVAVAPLVPRLTIHRDAMRIEGKFALTMFEILLVLVVYVAARGLFRVARTLPQRLLAVGLVLVVGAGALWTVYDAGSDTVDWVHTVATGDE